ncbi:MAG: GNAT family N-acetyltransferase [Candidatus Merdivicinus sp.]|jgi:predicted GNAT family N-acyltransferase
MKIKRLTAKELPEAQRLCQDVFLEFEAPEYPKEGTQSFLEFLNLQQLNRMLVCDLLRFWGVYENSILIGVGALREQKHISLLFVKKEYQRRGVASFLMQAMLNECCKANISTVTVNASPYGIPFYLAIGFNPLSEEQCQNGIRFIPMERTL